jgi:hypothetical protein
MKIRLENCDLEICYIGTREEIDMQIFIDQLMDWIPDFGNSISVALMEMCNAIGDCFHDLAESFRSEE